MFISLGGGYTLRAMAAGGTPQQQADKCEDHYQQCITDCRGASDCEDQCASNRDDCYAQAATQAK